MRINIGYENGKYYEFQVDCYANTQWVELDKKEAIKTIKSEIEILNSALEQYKLLEKHYKE